MIAIEVTDPALDARDCADLADYIRAALEAPDDEAAWRPMRRARLLLERARLIAESPGVTDDRSGNDGGARG